MTTLTIPTGSTAPLSPMARLGWLVADSWVVAKRTLTHWVRDPFPVIFGLSFPVMITLMFSFLFGGAMDVPDGASYPEFLLPGMFGMIMVFGISTTMVAVSEDAKRGVTDRFRSMPMSPGAVLLGRAIADFFDSIANLGVLVLCGLAIGWRWHGSVGSALVAFGLLLLLRFAFLWIGMYLGLVLSTSAHPAVQTLEFPFGFLANTFVATSTMPFWLGAIADWNPLSATVAASRQLFGNPGWGDSALLANHAILIAICWPLVLLAIFVPLAVRRYRLLSH